MKFKKGDKVEIISNIPFGLLYDSSPLLGTVISVDGFYIIVRPRYKRYTAEFYENEIKQYKNIKKERKLKLKHINKVQND
jgi:hypothetical protein